MVQFNELKINSEGNKLIIDIAIKDLDYCKNVYIDSIKIDTQNTYEENKPSSKVVYEKTLEGNKKFIRLELGRRTLTREEDENLINFKNNLFFIWIKTKGIADYSKVPCGCDKDYFLGTVFYPFPLYCGMLKILQSHTDNCNPSKKFIDAFFNYKALQFSLISGDNISAIKYFNKLYKRSSDKVILTTNCRCHGK